MNEADCIYVLDTGSNDNTVDKLKNRNVIVKEKKIVPWRFDIARNLSLDMVPNDVDICVCTDLDEVFEKGWRKELEKLWSDKINRLQYNYNWSLDENNKPLVNFYISKIHRRDNYIWKHPVHEVLSYLGSDEKVYTTDCITLNHYPDIQKSRSSYLPLLELSIQENPNDDRNMHYLGREYMYYEKWNECIDTLIKHLNMPNANWKDERCASMRFIARCYTKLNRVEEARMWLEKAIIEAPHLRDPLVESAILEYELNNWKEVIKKCELALKIEYKYKNYITEQFSWDHTIYDLLSIAYFNTSEYKKSLECINEAINISPNIERLRKNKDIILEKVII